MSQRLGLALCLVVVCVFIGCASLNGTVPFQYQPSLVASSKTIDKTVGINMLADKRPEGDVSYTKSIKDIPEKITSKFIEDLEKSKIFKEVHFPAQQTDDIVIDGSIDRFMWKLYASPISYIPFLNLVIYFGVPCNEAYGITGISLEVKDNKSGAIIGKLAEESKITETYTIYNMKAGEAGAELAESFRDVSKKLKEDMLTKVNIN